MNNNYFINESYVHRTKKTYFNDTNLKNEWQKEVYEFAKNISLENKFSRIIDVGTGSAYKLLYYFDEYDTIGIDVPKTVAWLKNKYPNRQWRDSLLPIKKYDMIIASDIIEHMLYPNLLLNFIEKSQPKLIVISTPDRSLLNNNGPPVNIYHIREWSFQEFHNYIESRFTIIQHFISNIQQCTQVVLARLK